jgi:pepF/M3 family oligoendopeptidase
VTEKLPHWDLSNVYPGLDSPELREGMAELSRQLDTLDATLERHQVAPGGPVPAKPEALAAVAGEYLDGINALLRHAHTLRNYVYAVVATDSYNQTARRLMSEIDALLVRSQRLQVLFRGWLGTAAAERERFEAALALPGPAHDHHFYLQEQAEQSRYMMSEAEETLAAELSLSGAQAWQNLQGVVTSQLKVALKREGDRLEELPITVLQNLRTDPHEEVRRQAYEVEVAAWERVREPLAACLNGVKGTVGTLDRRRGRRDSLHQTLDQERIDRETLDAMLGAMQDSFPAFRRYFRHKARLLGKEALPWWDIFAPVGRAEDHFTWQQAQDFVLEQFASFSPELEAFGRRAFEERWIDAEPRDGKRGGAFCMGVPAVEESRVFCNFDGTLDGVLTLAHELGHAYHNECQAGKTMLQMLKPMTLAETASIMNETIVTNALLKRSSRPEEKQAILEAFLQGAGQVIVDIYSRFLFEQEVFRRRAEAELSADDFCNIMLSAQRAAYGDGLDDRYLHPYMWAWKPHYYRPTLSFYNFPYAFGLLFGLGLYRIYQERGEAFVPEYRQLLRDSGEGSAAELAARFGIDITKRPFWEGSLHIVEERIEEYRAL